MTLVLSATTLVVLLSLPGTPPYYKLAASIGAKTYSTSMMAVLNSRIKTTSNMGAFRPPLWNELMKLAEPDYVDQRQTSEIVFQRNDETDLHH